MKKRKILTGIGVLYVFFSLAQNDIDAMRYSQLTFGGTARFASMAGSMSALGGDISTLSFNPAGIAVFKKTELTISPSIFSERTSSTYKGAEQVDGKLNFNLGNIGLVASKNLKENPSGWQNINFGFGYNRTNNFHARSTVQGYNKTSSLLDVFVANANGNVPSDFDGFSTGLAWETYLINPKDTSGSLQYNHVITNYGELQKKSVESKGSMGETVISFGGNYKNKVLLGATLGIVNARYSEESTYEEIDEKDTIKNFKSFSYTQNLDSKGRGVNLKLGVIVKPNDWLRIGAAIHTPTQLNMHDDYSSSMKSDLEGGIKYDTSSQEGKFDYSITTPFRAIGSIGFIINKNALLNAEYEYIDYASAQLYSHPNVFSDVNSAIRSKYTSTGNFRAGGEVRFDPLAFRIGYAFYGSPFRNGNNSNASRSSYTAGIGFRDNNYFVDFAYVYTRYTEYNYLYDPALTSSVKNNYRASSFMLTLGVRF
jgi:long-subunit fatty acid transport protein